MNSPFKITELGNMLKKKPPHRLQTSPKHSQYCVFIPNYEAPSVKPNLISTLRVLQQHKYVVSAYLQHALKFQSTFGKCIKSTS